MQQNQLVKFLRDSALYLGLDPVAAVNRICKAVATDDTDSESVDQVAPWLCRLPAGNRNFNYCEGIS